MRVAAVDIGSNSIHMVVAQVESDGRFRVLDRAKEMVRLASGCLNSGKLPAATMQAGLRTLAAFRTLAERHGVTRFKAVATSAVREAVNGGDFIRQIEEQVGLRVKVIPGREEARLIHLGVQHAVDLRGDTSLIVDVGGGSVEMVLVEDERPVALESLQLGVVRLGEKFLASDPPTTAELEALENHLAEQLDPVLAHFADRSVRRVVATSGTLLNLIAIAGHLRGDPPDGHLNHFEVTAEEIRQVRRLLSRADREGRLRVKGLDAKRVDFILAGAYLADYVMRALDVKQMIACTWALREGLLLDFIARHRKGIEETERFTDARRRSVARLARHLGHVDAHGHQVARLALRLFDQLQNELKLEPAARDWLEFAAILHDVGHHIGHKNHERHSYYLITNGELLGFGRDELEIIGQTARYHRKGGPKDSADECRPLSRSQRRLVRALSAILRVADGLDRTHYGIVRDVTVTARGERLTLQLRTAGDPAELEVWEARRRAGLLQDLMGRDIDFRVVSEP
jgi:exopolyphosphatase / guanosine-5'-triphosphate,3'-diphosphate pyrophosphatase